MAGTSKRKLIFKKKLAPKTRATKKGNSYKNPWTLICKHVSPAVSKGYLAVMTPPKPVPDHSNSECFLKPPKIIKTNDFTKMGSKSALGKRMPI